MKRMMLGLGLLIAAGGTASAQSLEVAQGDWSEVPAIRAKGEARVTAGLVERLHTLAGESDCKVPGFERRRINLTVPFVIRFTPQGGVERIVLRGMGCPQLESLLGTVVLRMAQAGEFRPTGENQERWYRSELALASR